ncbi:MAG: HAMP domain-containing histidine kinase [Chloroflexi bacterium]|nr:HAMP domain-containing histidine kinase [Chloroflexota bacterium]
MTHTREWSNAEVDALVTAANLLGATIKRRQMDSLLQNQLQQRQTLISELEAKNAELERFTYTVSHDLRSPLVTIKGFLGYLERDVTAGNLDAFRKDIQRIGLAADRMDNLLKDLLELSRIGRIGHKPQALAFAEVVREAQELVHGRLQQRGITVQVQPELPVVYGDKPRLTEVVQNLLDNAAKYMGNQQEPLIEIGAAGVDGDNKAIIFMRDNGLGIDPQYHERIFGLFDKLDANSEGTGVGLALVKRIVEFHRGRIWVESQGVGHGSTFYFTLPGVVGG